MTDAMICLTSTNFNLIIYTCLFPFRLSGPPGTVSSPRRHIPSANKDILPTLLPFFSSLDRRAERSEAPQQPSKQTVQRGSQGVVRCLRCQSPLLWPGFCRQSPGNAKEEEGARVQSLGCSGLPIKNQSPAWRNRLETN